MRVFISSTSEELEPHRAAARDVVESLGFEPVLLDPTAGRGLNPVAACARQVASADLVLAIVGWRRGPTLPPELGGDGLRPWTFWEVRSAFDHGKPVAVLMTSEAWRPELREDDAEARAVMQDFRGELARLAIVFDDEPGNGKGSRPLSGFRDLVRRRLVKAQRRVQDTTFSGTLGDGLELRRWPPPKLPERPYPVLLHYTHPDLLAGRERQLDELRRQLQLRIPIVGLYAPSGTGKSSLLAAGLVPRLRAEGRPVAFDRNPCETGIAARLIGDLLQPPAGRKWGDSQELEITAADVAGRAPHTFVDRLRAVRRLAGEPPVLVLDQFDDLLRHSRAGPEARRARMVVGTLLAASAQHLPGLDGPPCRWLLAYRQEFHGEVFLWLGDVLREARAEGLAAAADLPHDLSGPERFHAWPLQPLGTPAPGSEDRVGEAARVFQAAIEAPLALATEDGAPRYPWRFAAGGAQRLARAFGEARAAQPGAPLAPELQVVLAHLLERAGEPGGSEPVLVEVPEEPGELIDQALEDHLRRALDAAFPTGGPARQTREAQLGRTRALLALRELAGVQGRRDEGLPVESLARAIGSEGHEVLEKLATPATRLVVLQEQAEGWSYVLSHDRMAEKLVRLVDHEGQYAGLGIDEDLLGLRRYVALQSELFEAGEMENATEVPKAHYRRIEEHADALLWGDERQRWWVACQKRRRYRQRRSALRRSGAALAVALVALGAWSLADRWAKRKALYGQVASAEPEAAFAALALLATERGADAEKLRAALRQREKPLDVLERGVGGARRGAAVLRVAEIALPLVEEAPEDPVALASLVWALDAFAAREPDLAQRAAELRDRALAPWRRRRPPPAAPCPEAADWAAIPAGTFAMGGKSREDEQPEHRVTISAFRMSKHEVTNAQYRLLVPDREGEADLPATRVTWYEAYTYAAWLGGRLPTEAEWEYAARAGCAHAYCQGDGSAATLDEVAWWVGNATDPETLDQAPQPVRRLAPNPWGLHDVFGNVSEMSADWLGAYSAEPQSDPVGPTDSAATYRVRRGGSVWDSADSVSATQRASIATELRGERTGFRVALPACSSAGRPD